MKGLNYFLIAVLICLVVITTIIGVDNETNRRKEMESAISNSTKETQQLESITERTVIYVPNYNNGAEVTTPQVIQNITYQTYEVPNIDTSFMAYMDYRKITDETSTQYEMQQQAYTDENGFRKIGEDYCIALGSYYTNYECGIRFKITLDNGYSFTGIIADLKDDRHTDKETHTHIKKNGNVVEYIIDDKVMPNKALKLGNLGWYFENLDGQIKTIERIK